MRDVAKFEATMMLGNHRRTFGVVLITLLLGCTDNPQPEQATQNLLPNHEQQVAAMAAPASLAGMPPPNVPVDQVFARGLR
jgi:hypothetical protein